MAATIMHFVSNHITIYIIKCKCHQYIKLPSHSIGMDLWMDVEHCTGIRG